MLEPGGGAGGAGPTCGNGIVEGVEECDDGNGNDANCCSGHGPCGPTCRLCECALCGNGKIDPAEECDQGPKNSNAPTAACTPSCKKNGHCGDGIVQEYECCDDGALNGKNFMCSLSCACQDGSPTFGMIVTSAADPSQGGKGIGLPWSYKGLLGVQAGKAWCQAVGADHVCSYSELVQADAAGELDKLPKNLSYWLQRSVDVADPAQAKSCAGASDCGGSDDCDPKAKVCSYKPGVGGNCNSWTNPDDGVADGEWFEVYDAASTFNQGAVHLGKLSFHFDPDAAYDGTSAHVCPAPKLSCAGPCGGVARAIPCCFPAF